MGAQNSSSSGVGGVGRTQSFDDNVASRINSRQHRRTHSVSDDTGLTARNNDKESGVESGRSRNKGSMVIVHKGVNQDPEYLLQNDPLYQKLDNLPLFVPLMHDVEQVPKIWGIRNQPLEQIRAKIDASPFINIVRIYEDRLREHATLIGTRQGKLSRTLKEVDGNISLIFRRLTERQKKFAKIVDNFSKIPELVHTLTKCQQMVKECERTHQILNGMLPIDDRLEPFSWPDAVQSVFCFSEENPSGIISEEHQNFIHSGSMHNLYLEMDAKEVDESYNPDLNNSLSQSDGSSK